MNLNPPGPQAPFPPRPGQPFGPATTLSPKTSGMAVASLILGIATVPMVFLCLGLITGPLALVFGIVALAAIGKGAGRIKGRGLAWGGIICAVAGLVLYGLFLGNLAGSRKPGDEADRQTRAALDAAESKISTNTGGKAHGSSAGAETMAGEFAAAMKVMHEAFFVRTGGKPKLQLSGGEFVTYCHSGDQGCAFIVHVPSYRHHEKEAKDDLRDIAWMVANQVAAKHPELTPAGTPLAVGLRGSVLYGAVMTGAVGDEDPASVATTESPLLEFFREPGGADPTPEAVE